MSRKSDQDYRDLSLFLVGDAFITTPWSDVDEPEFLSLISYMRAADVTAVNLETVIHSYRGYAQADSGGTWAGSPPEISQELAWAGVNVASHANNHAFDYGSEGVLETIEHMTSAGILVSGSGKDLQAARAPAEIEAKGRRIGHLSMAATFVPYGKASRSRSDIHGRPGVNPLAVRSDTVITLPPALASAMRRVDGLMGRDLARYSWPRFRRFNVNFELGRRLAVTMGRRLVEADREGNLAAISKSAETSDLVIVSIHAHEQSGWLRQFAHDAVAAGAGVIIVHGPHEVRGIEFIENCPVFYGLGNFVYQASGVAVLPSDAYEAAGLDDQATPLDIFRTRGALASLAANPKTYEGCAALLKYADNQLAEVALLPVELHRCGVLGQVGRPRAANASIGEKIIGDIARRSRRYGADVTYDAARNVGLVKKAVS
jgi:poly-gamma-glutamate capsule biosynthesis protein CapA/YwtB (metallophosphatase superfamily)